MSVNWEARRRHIAAWQELVKQCVVTYDNAVSALGRTLSHGEAVDLLLDNHPALKDAGEARNALRYFPQARRGFHS
jgi:hypothetical protein